MVKNAEIQKELQVIASLQRELNLATAALLLTGQITVRGVFILSGEFSISLSGPLLGEPRIEGKFGNRIATSIVDVIDIIIAILLIIDAIQVLRSVIGPGFFSIIVSGPIFGTPKAEPTLPSLKRNYNFFKKIVSKHFNVDPTIFRKK